MVISVFLFFHFFYFPPFWSSLLAQPIARPAPAVSVSMNTYFANFISRFGGNDIFSGSTYANTESAKVPEINFLTLFNPTWADENDESLENLSKQILFFISPGDSEETQTEKSAQHLNVVGLLRGSCSLATEFGDSTGPVRIQVSGATIVVVELEPQFQLALSIASPPSLCERHEMIGLQMEKLIYSAHRYFRLINPTFAKLEEIHGPHRMSEILREYWRQFMVNFDAAAAVPLGPRLLGWPHRLNPRGLFLLMPPCYRKSHIRVPDSLRGDLDEIVQQSSVAPAAYFVLNLNKSVPKNSGLIYCNDYGNNINKDSLRDLFNLLDFLDCHGALDGERLEKRNPLSNLFALLESTSIVSDDEEEDEVPTQFSLSPAAAIEMLHPVNITNNLVIQPLRTTVSTTVNGIRSLGLAMSSIPWFLATAQPDSGQTEDSQPAEPADNSGYIVGTNNGTLTRFLVHLLTGDEVIEYLVVLYGHNGVVQGFLFDSGLEQLSQSPFYEDLKWEVCTQAMGVLTECFQIASCGIGLTTSISSLPNTLKTIIAGKPEVLYDDVDRDFFFIIYDSEDHSYQSSLPDLPMTVPTVDGQTVKVAQSLHNAIFHLHDQLADHFVVKSAGRIFGGSSAVNEHLHKFSSNRNNNWLFYAIRHKTKTIVVIRNYNIKNKSKIVARPEPTTVLDSVQGYASFGFLDTLGEDVKVWLERLGRDKTEPETEEGGSREGEGNSEGEGIREAEGE